MELDTLKVYNKINLANKFIRLSKSPANTLAFFEQKLYGSFQLNRSQQSQNQQFVSIAIDWGFSRLIKLS